MLCVKIIRTYIITHFVSFVCCVVFKHIVVLDMYKYACHTKWRWKFFLLVFCVFFFFAGSFLFFFICCLGNLINYLEEVFYIVAWVIGCSYVQINFVKDDAGYAHIHFFLIVQTFFYCNLNDFYINTILIFFFLLNRFWWIMEKQWGNYDAYRHELETIEIKSTKKKVN